MRISSRILESVADHARRSAPRECCGILMCIGGVLPTVDFIIPANNVEKGDPERGYVLDHKSHLKAVEMEALGDACIAGYYHSHAAGRARPSNQDVKQAVGDVTYLITGMFDGQVEHAAWRLEEGDMIPEPLEVVG